MLFRSDMTVTEFVEDELPAADVEPVRHGAWYPRFEDWRQQQEGNKCSVCGFSWAITGIAEWAYFRHSYKKYILHGQIW